MKYPPNIQLLDIYSGNQEGPEFEGEYQDAIENVALLFTKQMLDIITIEDLFNIIHLLPNGSPVTPDYYSDTVKNIFTRLKEVNLHQDKTSWETLISQYSQPNLEDIAVSPLMYVKKPDDGTTNQLKLFAYQLVKRPNYDHMFYEELQTFDTPKTTLYALVPKSDGSQVWYGLPVDVRPSRGDNTLTFAYDINLHTAITIIDSNTGLSERVELQGLPLVIKTTQETILDLPMPLEIQSSHFQLTGEFRTASQAGIEEPADAPLAELTGDPKGVTGEVVTATNTSEVDTAAVRAQLEASIQRGVERIGKPISVPLIPGQEVKVNDSNELATTAEEFPNDAETTKNAVLNYLQKILNSILHSQ